MHELPYLRETVLLFGAALAVIVVCQRLRVPPVVGYLLTGALVGPSGLALVRETHHVEVFAELGVVFLLFVIGLEFSPARLKRLARLILLGGGLQVTLTAALVLAVGLGLGLPPAQGVFFGFVVALSSTAVVLKLYHERRELEAPHGQAALGILLFQDFLIVPLLLVVPLLAGTGDGGAGSIALRFATGLGVVAAVFAAGRFVLPAVLRLVVRTRVRELTVLGSLAACLGAALLTETLGFSLALGAFLAGILIAESDYRHQVLADTASFRDVFTSVFFISIGMLLRLDFAATQAPLLLGLAAAVVVGKAAVALGVVRIAGFPAGTALAAGLGLAQIGEFSFVLVQAGRVHELVGERLYQLTIATAILTMVATPALVAVAPWLAARLPGRSRRAGAAEGRKLADHIVVAGFGLNGRHLARVLREARVAYVAVDADAEVVRRGRAAGEPVLLGDAARRDILEECGIERAREAVFLLSDPWALRRAVGLARGLNPALFIVARAGRVFEIEELRGLGADEVIAEELETSIEIVTRVLTRLHLPRNLIRAQARLLRADGYQMLREQEADPGLSERLVRALSAEATDTFQLASEHAAAGSTLKDLGLRGATGATVLAVVRGETPRANPPPDLELAPGDLLVLVGSHAQVEAAFRILERGAKGQETRSGPG